MLSIVTCFNNDFSMRVTVTEYKCIILYSCTASFTASIICIDERGYTELKKLDSHFLNLNKSPIPTTGSTTGKTVQQTVNAKPQP